MENDPVRQLAETLMKTGMASSTYDAMEKAKSILNVKSQKPYDSGQAQQNKPVEKQQPMPNIGVDIKDENATLNELMRELGIDPEQVAEQEKEQRQEKLDNAEEMIGEIKEEIKEAENAPEKFEQIKEEIGKVKEEIVDIEAENEEIADIEAKNEEQVENIDKENIDEEQLNIDDELQSLESEQQTQQPEQQAQEDEQQGPEQEGDFEEEEKE